MRLTSPVSAQMRATRRRDTRPELLIRRALHRRGLRYHVDRRIGEGRGAARPDVQFARERVAVFVDGCFWHSCPEHCRVPASNVDYWIPKLRRNAERDRRNDAALEAAGWVSIRVWEHEDPEAAADRIAAVVARRRAELGLRR